jgi:hypothetical protein
MIEGDSYFDRSMVIQHRTALEKERQELEMLDVNKGPATGGAPPRIPSEKRISDTDDAEYGDGGNQ